MSESNDAPVSNAAPHQCFLLKEAANLKSVDDDEIETWALSMPDEDELLAEWANRFRQTYCLDDELDELRDGTGLSRSEYLLSLVFPSLSGLGPSVRAGDFAELLVADYVEHVLGYQVPRLKYADKTNPDESMKGVDVVGFQCSNPHRPQLSDELLVFEVKARLTGSNDGGRLQDAIDDSGKDFGRLAYSLNKAKRLLHSRNDMAGVQLLARFQNKADRPFKLQFGAGAVLTDSAYNTEVIEASSTAEHPNRKDLRLLVIHGSDLMSLVHALYERAADEA